MKTKISCLIIAFSALLSYQAYSQLTIPQLGNAQCPGVALSHTVINPVGAACVYDWVVTNGTIQGGTQSGSNSTLNNAGTDVIITWSSSSTSGSIKVTAKSCSPTPGNASATLTAPILSLNGVTPGAVTGSPGATAVQINSTPNFVFTAPQIQYPTRGSSDPSPYNITTYEWEIPSGWTVVSGGTSNPITVRANNCSAGNVRVRGKASCASGNFFSNWSAPFAITRTLGNPGAITGPASVNCTDVSTKTYSISAVPGATSYTWDLPFNWTGTSTTTSITVTPNGLNAGTLTVRANGCSLQSAVSSLPITITLTNPASPPNISGTSPVCFSGRTFTLLNFPASSTVTWTQSSNLVNTSGQGTTAYTVRASSSTSSGGGWVEASITTPCGVVPPIRFNVWVGQPMSASDVLKGSGSIAINSTLEFSVADPNNGAAGAVTYDWGISGGYFSYGQPTSQSTYVTITDQYLGLYVAIRNVCGPSGEIGRSWSTENGGCPPGETCMARVFPNPATNELTVALTSTEKGDGITEVKLVDQNGQTVYHVKPSKKSDEIKIPVKDFKDGTYYLTVRGNRKTEQRQIIVSH